MRDANFLGELQAGNPFASRDQQIHGVYPLVQRDMATLKDGARADGEVFFALVTAIEAVLAGCNAFTHAA